jgi:hypothetical protein
MCVGGGRGSRGAFDFPTCNLLGYSLLSRLNVLTDSEPWVDTHWRHTGHDQLLACFRLVESCLLSLRKWVSTSTKKCSSTLVVFFELLGHASLRAPRAYFRHLSLAPGPVNVRSTAKPVSSSFAMPTWLLGFGACQNRKHVRKNAEPNPRLYFLGVISQKKLFVFGRMSAIMLDKRAPRWA